jgi:geranylgeranyl transferase type-2 subunit alpha
VHNIFSFLEFDLVKAAIYTDPEDQSAWLYYWWLIGRAPEKVEFQSAYQLINSSLVILGFNDAIKFTRVPELYNQNNENLSGKLYPLNEGDESSSVWLYLLDSTITVDNIRIQSETVLPSNSSKTVPENQKWELAVNQIKDEKGKMIVY